MLRGLLPESNALWLDLLDPDLEHQLAQAPSRLNALLDQERETHKRDWVVIDEIQRVPALLSIVQQRIQKKHFNFALTGSSARKLKRGAANLLGGRASWFELSSLTHLELGDRFDLNTVLNWGSLPETFDLDEADRTRLLKAYSNIYLKEEVIAEQLVRKVQPFRNFLELAALQNAQIINYSKFAKDCDVDVTTIQTYFEILQDTLVGFELPPFHTSIRKRQRKNPKFYFFDTGVTRAMAGLLEDPVHPRTALYGKYFEQFVITEIRKLVQARERDWKLSYLSSKDGAEIDLIVEKRSGLTAIEIKSNERVDEKEVGAFERLASDLREARLIYASRDERSQRHGQVECLHWREAIAGIFS